MTDPYADGPENGAAASVAADTEVPAPPSRRIAAGVIDAGLLLVALGFVLLTELTFASEGQQDLFMGVWAVVVAPLFFALYHAFGTGATPGQLELRIGLRDARTGELPGLARTIVRAYLGFVFLVLVLPAIADLLLALGGLSIRDRITRTNVVRITFAEVAPELPGETIPELVPIFEPPPGTRRYLRRGWRLLRARPRLVVGTVAALYAVLVVVAVILGFLVVADSPDEWTILTYTLFAALLLTSGIWWTQAAVVVGVADVRVGGPDASVWATLVRASRRVNALTAALLVLLALTPLWYLVFPLLFLGRVSMLAPALVLEDTRVLGAFRRSWRLTEGHTLRLFGLVLLSATLLWGAGMAVALLSSVVSASGGLAGDIVGVALGAVVFVVVLAWLAAAWALVYEDARRAHPTGAGA